MAKQDGSDKEQPLPQSYGEAVQELEALVEKLESGRLPLEELLGHYRRGTELLGFCRARLRAVEEQVRVLDEDGTLQAWDPE